MERPSGLVRDTAPYLFGAVLVVLLTRSVFAAPFFLLPVAFLAIWRDSPYLWLTAIISFLINSLLVIFFSNEVLDNFGVIADIVYFGSCIMLFTGAVSAKTYGLRFIYRIALSSIFAALAMIPIIVFAHKDERIITMISAQADVLLQLIIESSGSDVVQLSLAEQALDSNSLLEAVFGVVSRGAVLVNFVIFVVTWQIAGSFLRKRNTPGVNAGLLKRFRNDPFMIWILIGSMSLLLGGLSLEYSAMEIVGWNLSLLCIILYGLQGYSVIQYNISRPSIPRLLGPLTTVILLLAMLRPGINAIIVIALALTGIAETWLPFRAPITAEPPSTPEA